jgi:hypothetical protein
METDVEKEAIEQAQTAGKPFPLQTTITSLESDEVELLAPLAVTILYVPRGGGSFRAICQPSGPGSALGNSPEEAVVKLKDLLAHLYKCWLKDPSGVAGLPDEALTIFAIRFVSKGKEGVVGSTA